MRGRIRLAIVALAGALTVVGLAPAASAAYGSEPVGPTWVPNGGVHAVVTDGSTVYVGGAFTGGVAALDALTGALKWQGTADADVRALALTGNGHLLLGGAFTTVGGATHRKIASVNAATGAVDAAFKGAVGGTVRDIVVVGNTAYFAGAFTNHGGMTQQGLGAVDATTGALNTAFTASANGSAYALGTDGTRLFIGGMFTAVDGLPRNQLASVTLATNALDAWAPARACTGCNVVWDLTLDNARNRVYTVGRNAGTLYTVDKTTARNVFTRGVGAVNGDSQAVTLAPDGHVYVGGHFVTINGQTRMLVAEFDVSGTAPVLGAFSTRFVTSYPGVWALTSTRSRLYVGGDFTQAGAQKRFPYFAIFADGSVDTTPPTVTATNPAAGATAVATSTDVTATFSEPVSGVGNTSFTLTSGSTSVAATVTSDSPTVARLHPNAALDAGVTYTATLTNAITDATGNHFAGTTWTFTTVPPPDTTPPMVTAISPGDGAPGVAITTDVTATFSEPVQGVTEATFTLAPAGGTAVTATVTPGSVANQWVLNPPDLTPGTTYTATLTGGPTAIRDNANNPLTTISWSFTTSTDTTAPTVTATAPRAGATGFSRTANVTAAFSEPVQNVTTSTFTLRPTGGGPNVSAQVNFNSTGGRWALNPAVTLDPNTSYTATITNGVTDLAGNAFAGLTWSFTTGA